MDELAKRLRFLIAFIDRGRIAMGRYRIVCSPAWVGVAAALLVIQTVSVPATAGAPAPTLDLEKLSGEIYDHQSVSTAPSTVYARAQSAVYNAIPPGTPLREAKVRLNTAGFHCRAIKKTPDIVRCRAVMLESFENRDFSSIVWRVDIKSDHGAVSNIHVDVS